MHGRTFEFKLKCEIASNQLNGLRLIMIKFDSHVLSRINIGDADVRIMMDPESDNHTSLDPGASPSTVEILRLKRKLAATHQELDDARVGRRKKILYVCASDSL